ncbi:hypothetical protein [Teredinibacter waterburyi]|uniref:hypothetical protein n=1 Tax=Teredinibacter waterburyi TaxID=1500538 RepID=UPI001660068B|nr:hypothetical protein [Teredinibacter waterburyi]
MSLFRCSSQHQRRRGSSAGMDTLSRVRGDILIESLIGMLLFGIAGMGASYISSSVSVSQKDMKVQDLVVTEMRSRVMNRTSASEYCDGSAIAPVTVAGTEIAVTATCNTVSATVNSVSIANISAPITLNATIESLGDVRVGQAAQQN